MRLNIKLVLCWLITCIHLNSVAIASLQDGLLGHWKLDEEAGNIAKDSSGKSNHGKLTAGGKGTTWKPGGGKVGGALYFDGSGEQVADDRGKEYINGLTAFTVALWVKSDQDMTDSGFIDGRDPGGDDTVLGIRYDKAGFEAVCKNLLNAGITTSGGIQRLETSNETQSTDWQHLALTWSSNNQLAMYIDGVLDQPTFNSKATKGKMTDASKTVIGQGEKDKAGAVGWKGLIDDVRIYNRVLKEAEIADLAAGKLAVEAQAKLTTIWAAIKE